MYKHKHMYDFFLDKKLLLRQNGGNQPINFLIKDPLRDGKDGLRSQVEEKEAQRASI